MNRGPNTPINKVKLISGANAESYSTCATICQALEDAIRSNSTGIHQFSDAETGLISWWYLVDGFIQDRVFLSGLEHKVNQYDYQFSPGELSADTLTDWVKGQIAHWHWVKSIKQESAKIVPFPNPKTTELGNDVV